MSKKVLIAAPVHPLLIEGLQHLGYECVQDAGISTKQALLIIAEFEGIITSTRLHIDQQFIDKALQLKWVGRMGSGMEIMDTAYADKIGLFYCSSPEGNANAVAEQALGMLLALQHKILSAHLELKNHIWLREENRGFELEGKIAGIIGFGHNGSAFARKLKAMNVQVLGYDAYKNNYSEPGITACTDLQMIYEQADVISFHVPLTLETHHYFNTDFLAAMCKSFVLLNLSRGPVVALDVLEAGLINGQINAAAIDVWETEPIEKMDPSGKARFDRLMQMPQFIGTPHIAGYTHQSLFKMSKILLAKISDYLIVRPTNNS